MTMRNAVKRSGRFYFDLKDYSELRTPALEIMRTTREYFQDPPSSQRLDDGRNGSSLSLVEKAGPVWLWVNFVGVDLYIRCDPNIPTGGDDLPSRGRFEWRYLHRDELTEEISVGDQAVLVFFDEKGNLWDATGQEGKPIGAIRPGTSGPSSKGEVTKLLSRALKGLRSIDHPERYVRFPEHST